jgi:pre-mRNA-splicing factor SYF2
MTDPSTESRSSLADRLAKFQELRVRREDAAAQNLASTKAEDAELRTNPQTRARLLRKQAKAEAFLAKAAAAETKTDLQRLDNLTYTMEETERWNEKLIERETRKDPGFTDYAQLTQRKYEKRTAKLDVEAIQKRSKEEALTAMATEIQTDQIQRTKHSRRKRYDDTEDITFINERNARFNKKAARAYDEYTEELRDSLERGTAV